jgi:alanine dehydrogenase
MTLVLSNDDIDAVLEMGDCVEVLEQAYRDQAELKAVNRPRSDVHARHPERPDAIYSFKSFEGLLPSAGVVALRINSDVVEWKQYAGNTRRDKVPAADGHWVGLVLLFSIVTGEPLAIFPDGVLQRMRVGATNGMAANLLARQDAHVLGLLGAGWQAGAQVMAMRAVRPIDEVRVYSPNPASRQAFADEWSERLGLAIRPVDSAREAVAGADIVSTATNSLGRVIEADWVEPSQHLTCVKRAELGEAVLSRVDRLVIHSDEGMPQNYLVGIGPTMIPSHDPTRLLRGLSRGEVPEPAEVAALATHQAVDDATPTLRELVVGRVPGRGSQDEITAFVNNIGIGLQFAAVGALAYRRAKERGLGHDLPTNWFTEDKHP